MKSRAPYNPSPTGGIRIADRPTRADVRARAAGDLRRHGAHRRPHHRGARPARPRGHALRQRRLRDRRRAPQRHAAGRCATARSSTASDHAEYLQLANAQACFLAADRRRVRHRPQPRRDRGAWSSAPTSSTPVLTTNPQPVPARDAADLGRLPVGPPLAVGARAPRPSRPRALPPILHGIDVESFPFGERPGRLSPVPRPVLARRRARTGRSRRPACAGRRLVLAGKVDAVDAAHFAEAIEPQIDGDRIRYVGEVDGDAEARSSSPTPEALLFPIEWDEPFGLVMIEALACGTPVIGFRRASVPEVVDDGRDGLRRRRRRRDGPGDRPHRRDRPASLPRRAEERFSVGRMVDDYERDVRPTVIEERSRRRAAAAMPSAGRLSRRAAAAGRW